MGELQVDLTWYAAARGEINTVEGQLNDIYAQQARKWYTITGRTLQELPNTHNRGPKQQTRDRNDMLSAIATELGISVTALRSYRDAYTAISDIESFISKYRTWGGIIAQALALKHGRSAEQALVTALPASFARELLEDYDAKYIKKIVHNYLLDLTVQDDIRQDLKNGPK